MTLCQVTDLSISFGGVRAVEALDVRVHRGEVVALIGPNGAGKTTVLNCLCGFYLPDRGRVELDGENLRRFSPDRRARLGVGRTFQTPQVFRSMTAEEHVQVALRLRRSFLGNARVIRRRGEGGGDRPAEQEAAGLLELCGLGSYGDVEAGALPLGLQRNLELARALALAPRLLLLDEPASGMEREETRKLGELVLRLRDTYGVGILLVEHDMALVDEVADYVYVMDHGRLLAEGDLARVRRDPAVISAYLGGGHEPAAVG